MKQSSFKSIPVLLIAVISIIFLTFACFEPPPSAVKQEHDYWPTDAWRTASPEEQGMDLAILDQMLISIADQQLNIDSLLVVRNSFIVLEKYYPLYEQDTLHELYSVTKSIISALVGIAIEEGYINSVDDPVMNYFPGKSVQNDSTQKHSLTIEHLLTMSSGLEWDFDEMVSTPDWVQYTLDQTIYIEPGIIQAYF